MKKRAIIIPSMVTVFVALSPAGIAFADNPHLDSNGNRVTTGQPNKEANFTAGSSPQGFLTGGFANAETHYADPSSVPSGNPKAKSQYDVAGFQFCTHNGTPCG
jgi:hypothetical protein